MTGPARERARSMKDKYDNSLKLKRVANPGFEAMRFRVCGIQVKPSEIEMSNIEKPARSVRLSNVSTGSGEDRHFRPASPEYQHTWISARSQEQSGSPCPMGLPRVLRPFRQQTAFRPMRGPRGGRRAVLHRCFAMSWRRYDGGIRRRTETRRCRRSCAPCQSQTSSATTLLQRPDPLHADEHGR